MSVLMVQRVAAHMNVPFVYDLKAHFTFKSWALSSPPRHNERRNIIPNGIHRTNLEGDPESTLHFCLQCLKVVLSKVPLCSVACYLVKRRVRIIYHLTCCEPQAPTIDQPIMIKVHCSPGIAAHIAYHKTLAIDNVGSTIWYPLYDRVLLY